MVGYNRITTRTNIKVLLNIGPGAGGGRKKENNSSSLPNTFDGSLKGRTYMYDLLVTTPESDVLPLSYRRFAGAKATALGSYDKHPTYCYDWNVDMCYKCAMIRGTRQ